MIQDMVRNPDAARAFAQDPQPAFAQYEITLDEAALLEARSIESMTELGVHPNLQMKYLRVRRSPNAAAGAGPLDAYLARLQED